MHDFLGLYTFNLNGKTVSKIKHQKSYFKKKVFELILTFVYFDFQISHPAEEDRNRPHVSSVRATDQNMVPKQENEVEKGTQTAKYENEINGHQCSWTLRSERFRDAHGTSHEHGSYASRFVTFIIML